ncbi:baseplate J/gp47 family protein [Xanthobacter sp. DSM 24535]|uniref:baseplate J/gp47 family protein n=1 Tax=Roseixanthobacter psychrophilus TaxID=3119917 RepID=UPI00372B6213
MPFPLPSPAELIRRLEGRAEAAILRARPAAEPAAVARAVRSPRGMAAILLRVFAMELYEAHLHLRWWGDQYFPDTAEREKLERHASIWGVTRRPATPAIGLAVVTGTAGTLIPSGLRLQGAGSAVYEVLNPATVSDAGTATLSLRAIAAGIAGNAAAGLRLTPLALVTGLDPQEAVVDAEGLAGGAEIESDASLLQRLLAEIQEPAHGGARFDYPRWIQNKFPAVQVACIPNWVGAGTVGVVAAMGSAALPRPPTSTEIAAMAAELEIQRPVTAEVHVLAAALLPTPLTLMIDPYEARVRTAVEAARASFFAREATIGGRIYRSRLSEAISAAVGEYRHEIMSPTSDIIPARTELPVPGAISWVVPS